MAQEGGVILDTLDDAAFVCGFYVLMFCALMVLVFVASRFWK